MRRPVSVALLLACFLLAATSVFTADAPDVEMKVQAVAAFKNGLGFFLRQGNIKLADGQGKISFAPAATLGTLWLAPNDSGTSLEELVAYRYSSSRPGNVLSLEQLLTANAGKTVTVSYNQKEYTGEIIGLTEPEEKNPQHLLPEEEVARLAIVKPQTNLLLLKAEGRVIAMNLNNVSLVTLPDQPNYHFQRHEELKGLRFKLKGAGESANVTLGYLQKGLGWTPSYLVSLEDEKTARITMQAVVVNDVEDLANTDLFFVVGVPNFAYADIPSPMALQQSLAELMRDAEGMASAKASASGGRYSNAIVAQARAAEMDAASPSPSFSSTVGELVGAPEEDLFLYTRSGITLARGERGTYNVFGASVGFAHIYEWDIPDTSRVDPFGNPQNNYNQNNPDGNVVNTVWHSLRLKNTTKFPWTSAPAMVISGTKPVSQDTLLYTPKGATTNLKLTIATDVRTDRQELEVDRQPRVEVRPNTHFDVVTVEGTLKLKNYKSKDIELTIRKALVGSVLSASDLGKSVKVAQAVHTENPSSRLTWNVTLKAGEEKTITYRYKVLVRV